MIRKVHLVFKTHFDLGFTDSAAAVLETYRRHHLPRAYRVAQILAQSDRPEKFVWTTGAWLVHWVLENGSARERADLERAVAQGALVWNAMPFTPHGELMDASLFAHALGLSQALDRRFGRTTLAAKLTDVPGQTRAVLPLLRAAGVRFLHVGVNSGSALPRVPPVFVWRDPEGAEVVTAYHHYYGGVCTVPGLDEALAIEFTRDNLGPHSVEEIILIYRRLRAQFPGAEIVASSLDAFARRLLEVGASLPVVEGEIGDTWIHGAGSDPQKVAQFRELSRLRRRWLGSGAVRPESLTGFSDALTLVAEHTWGMDEKTHLGDDQNYEPARFEAALSRPNFQSYQDSWLEQREYITAALNGLPPRLRGEAERHLAALRPAPPDLAGFAAAPPGATYRAAHFELALGADGSIARLSQPETRLELAGPEHPLAAFGFECFGAEDYQRYFSEYTPEAFHGEWWLDEDFGKPGLNRLNIAHRCWRPRLGGLYQRRSAEGLRLVARLALPGEPQARFGFPEQLWLEVFLPDQRPEVWLELTWLGKAASRLPQAAWLSFRPPVPDPSAWRLDKMGRWVSPLEVVAGGGRSLHAVDSGVRYRDAQFGLEIQSLDAPLVAPGRPALLRFEDVPPDLGGGLHFNLYNNVWGTNFPAWNRGDARFRFRLLPTTEA